MIKIGTVDGPYIRRYGKENAYETIKSIGYDCIDYQRFINTDTPLFNGTESDFDASLASDRKQIESAGLEIYQTHGPWRFPPQDGTPEERAERFEKMAMSIRGTALLGCNNYVIHPIMPWGVGKQELQPLLDINLDFMGRLAEEGRKNGVVICLENMPMFDFPMAPPKICLDLAREINSPWLKICLDTGHCTTQKVNPADAVRMIGKDMLRALHIHDNDGTNDKHWVPYTGIIDWEDFKKALQDIKFDGCVSLETVPPIKFTGKLRTLQEKSLFYTAREIAGLPF